MIEESENEYSIEESNRFGRKLFSINKQSNPIGSLLLSSEDDHEFILALTSFINERNIRYRESKAKRDRARRNESKGSGDGENSY